MVAFIGFCIYISIGLVFAFLMKHVIDSREAEYNKIIDDTMPNNVKRSTFEFLAMLYLYLETTFLWPKAVWHITNNLKKRASEKRED